MRIEQAKKTDTTEVQRLLNDSNLIADDIDIHIGNFVIIRDQERIVATGGVELYSSDALLRSVAVDCEMRGRGLGTEICEKLKEMARANGISRLFLLTETAEEYFKNAGFVNVDRDSVPETIRQTEQFSSLCPSSATVMRQVL